MKRRLEDHAVHARPKRPTAAAAWSLGATAVITGAAVMSIEVLGARLLAPFFGVSLFVWTALIGTTLLALAAGYLGGGILADRVDGPGALYAGLILAGALVALVPALKAPVLKVCTLAGLRAGALTAALLLFAPSLVLLGGVTPLLLRLASQRIESLGRTAGRLYALSTLGSLLGTLATGFFLIGLIGVDRIFLCVGGVLIVIGALHFRRGRHAWMAAAAIILPLLALPRGGVVVRNLVDGTQVQRIESRDSFYGNVKVIDYSYASRRLRELVIDGLVQGGIDLNDKRSVYEYAYLAADLPRAIAPTGTRCLVIGLGIGVLPMWYQAQGIATEVVDIDPVVVHIARRRFGLDPRLIVHVADARTFLTGASARYDYIVLDVFSGDTTPGHLLSVEAMRLLRARLHPDGVLAVNLIGDIGPAGRMTASVVKTMRSVFTQIDVRPTFAPGPQDTIGNLVVLAHSGPPAVLASERIDLDHVHPMARDGVRIGLTRRVEPAAADAIVLTDDYNPIDVEDRAVKERVRRRIIETTDWDILLGRGPHQSVLSRVSRMSGIQPPSPSQPRAQS